MANNPASIRLNDHLTEYAQRKVASGEFNSVSDVVQDALRRAEERDERLGKLRELIQEGLDSGSPRSFDFAAFLEKMHIGYKGAA